MTFIVTTRTIVDRELTPEEENVAQQFVMENMRYMISYDPSDPKNIVFKWDNREVAERLIAATNALNPPMATVIEDE